MYEYISLWPWICGSQALPWVCTYFKQIPCAHHVITIVLCYENGLAKIKHLETQILAQF